jgi:hypothetical protein
MSDDYPYESVERFRQMQNARRLDAQIAEREGGLREAFQVIGEEIMRRDGDWLWNMYDGLKHELGVDE